MLHPQPADDAGADIDVALAFAHTHQRRFTRELADFLRYPSVSAQRRAMHARVECATWLADHLTRIGLESVSLLPPRSHPIVTARWMRVPGRPTVLIYGHYDVQPAEPLAEWRNPPFDPVIADGAIWARGASDDKGQLFCHVKAIESLIKTTGTLPVNVKCVFEGEEEIGSPNLSAALAQNPPAFSADIAVLSDTPMLSARRPAITYALRGAIALEVDVRTSARDLHSGNFGGAVPNALDVLCQMIGQLHDSGGRIAIEGLYDRIRRWSATERAYMATNGPSDRRILDETTATWPWGERGFSLYERMTIRPALSVNGVVGGYQGDGGKAVIPARALAKLSLRLVPDQDPDEVVELIRHQLDRLAPAGVECRVRFTQRARPVLLGRSHTVMRTAAAAYRHGFGIDPVFLRCGGTIPAVNLFHEKLRMPTALMGFAAPDDGAHAPNERFRLSNFLDGVRTAGSFLSLLSGRSGLAPISRPWHPQPPTPAQRSPRVSSSRRSTEG